MSNAGGDAPVRVEPEDERAWCGERRLELTPKEFATLRYLVERANRLVTKDELLSTVWGDAIVSEAALASCIRDLRRALNDSSRTPRYIETVHRRGFRFIGPLGGLRAAPIATGSAVDRSPPLVGREAELSCLRMLFETVHGGRRRLVFITGEAGIGKTTLVEAFLCGLGQEDVRIGRGQCVEHYGSGEAYLPVLEALARVAREPGGEAVVRVLRQYAPSWLAQLPALVGDEEVEAVQRRAQGTTHERMLRELAEALDVVSADAPLVLVIEDLHWSDSATVDLLATIARRREPSRLLILATVRPADAAASLHSLGPAKQELRAHGHCDELVLEFLDERAVADYVSGRFPHASWPTEFTRFLHRYTSGNPLFLVNLLDHLVARGHVREVDGRWQLSVSLDDLASDVPATLAGLIDKQIDRLTPQERAVLGVASVAGAEFSAALIAADGLDRLAAEECCATLARRGQFLREMGTAEWPDGTVAGRYAFIHALYRTVLSSRVPIGHRVGLHLRIGARLEEAYHRQVDAIAGELALHFEEGRDFERALTYRRKAVESALRHHGHREAANHAARALGLLQAFPDSPERDRQELAIHAMLGAALIPKGWAAPEVAQSLARAHELCNRVDVATESFPVLFGLWGFHATRGDLGAARELANQLATVAEATNDTAMLLGARNATGMVAFMAGDFILALTHLEQGLSLYDPRRRDPSPSMVLWGGHDTGVSCAVHAAWTLWLLGHPDRAAARMQQALEWARTAAGPFPLTYACHYAAFFHEVRREEEMARMLADDGIHQATEHGLELFASLAAIHRGWLCGDATEMRSGVTAYRATGGGFGLQTHLGLIAELDERQGRRDEGLAVVAEASSISSETGTRYWDAELERLRACLLLLPGDRRSMKEAEACFLGAIAIARRQKARTLELRAATSLGRLWQRQRRIEDARALLAATYAGFDEGSETPDFRDARSLLAELGARGRSEPSSL